MPIVVNRANGNLSSGDLEALDLTGDDNAIIFGGLALDTGSIATFNTATIGVDQFDTDSSHDQEQPLGTQTFITASGVKAPPTVSGNQTFTQNTTGAFPGVSYHMLDCSGVDPVTPLKEVTAPVTYNNSVPADITYNIDNGGLAILLVSTNIGSAPATIAGWTTFGTEKSISVMSSVRLYYRIAAADEVGATVSPTNGAAARGYSRVWVYNPESAPPPDVTPPVLSVPTSTNPTSVGFVPSVTTDEANGTAYLVVVPDGDSPTPTQVKAGQQSNGSPAEVSESVVVTTTGQIDFSVITDLDMGTDYELYFVHSDASANDSTMVTAAASTNVFGLTALIEHYTIYSGVLNSPHAASNSSGVGYDEETNRVGFIRNNAGIIYEYLASDLTSIEREITLGGNFDDMEGLTYMGNGEIAVCAENGGGYYVYIYDLPTGSTNITIQPKQLLTIADADTVNNNSSLEGITYDKILKIFWAVGEGEEAGSNRRIFRFARPVNTTTDYTSDDPELTIEEPFVAETFFAPYGATGQVFDLSGLSMDMTTGNLLVLSDTGSRLLQLNVDIPESPVVVSELDVTGLFQPEGVEVIDNGRLLVMGETNEYSIREASLVATIPLGLVTETNTSQAISFSGEYQIPIGQTVETMLSQVIQASSGLSLALGQVTETQVGNAITPQLALSQAIGVINELNQSQDISASVELVLSLGLSTEIQIAQQVSDELTFIQSILEANEAATAQTISSALVTGGQINQTNETNSAQGISTSTVLSAEVGRALENNTSFALLSGQTLSLALSEAQESNTPQAFTSSLQLTIPLGRPSSSDIANTISEFLVGSTILNRANETNIVGNITAETVLNVNIGQATETAFSQSVQTNLTTAIDLVIVNEINTAQNITAQVSSPDLQIGLATETLEAQGLLSTVDSILPLSAANETAVSQNITVSLGTSTELQLALESSLAGVLLPTFGDAQLQLSRALETNTALNIVDPFADTISYAILGPITSYKQCLLTSKKETKITSYKKCNLVSEIS